MDIIGYTLRCHQTSWEISYKWRSINERLTSMPRFMRPEGRKNFSGWCLKNRAIYTGLASKSASQTITNGL